MAGPEASLELVELSWGTFTSADHANPKEAAHNAGTSPEERGVPVDDPTGTTPWDDARERLADPEPGRHSWLATLRPDGRPHLMPVLTFWIEGALHFLAGEGTRKGRNLAQDGGCVIGIESRGLPSLDFVVEGRAEPVADVDAVRHITEQLNSNGWPIEAREDEVRGPNAPTAGPPP